MKNLRRSVGTGVAVASLGAFAGHAAAAPLPVYLSARTQLQARANFTGAFNLPNGAFFTDSTPSLTDPAAAGLPGFLAFKVAVISGSTSQGVWTGSNAVGSIVYTSPANGQLTDVSINSEKRIAFALDFASANNGVYVIEPTMGNFAWLYISQPNPPSLTMFGAPSLNNAGRIGFRAFVGLLNRAYYSWSPSPLPGGTFMFHAQESPHQQPPGPFSFLFSASFNDAGDMAGKCRRGDAGQTEDSRPDEIRIFHAGVSSTVIARDRDADPLSNFASFDNSVSLNDGGQVAFIATLVSPVGARAVYVSDGRPPVEIARSGVGGVGNIEFFAPSMNNRGQVAFRAFDSAGLRAVWVGDGASLRVAARQNDLVPIDAGQTGQISENNPNDPCFGASPRINSRGDVAFMAALIPPGQPAVELGSGAFIARGILPGDTNRNDAVNFADLNTVLDQFGLTGAPGGGAGSIAGDVTFDGVVDFADLNLVLSNFGVSI